MDWESLFERARKGDESVLDAAFDACEAASKYWSTETADAIAERWLWGGGWKSAERILKVGRAQAARRCRAAFRWMDGNVELVEGGARYVGSVESSVCGAAVVSVVDEGENRSDAL